MNDWKLSLLAAKTQLHIEREAARLAAIKATDRRIRNKQSHRRARARKRIERGWTLSTGQTLRPIA